MSAGRTGSWAGFDDPESFIRSNRNGLALLHALYRVRRSQERNAPPRIVFRSTRLIFNASPFPPGEQAPQAAHTPYAQAKPSCKEYLDMYAHCFGVPSTIFRLCVPYGATLAAVPSFGTIGAMLAKAKRGEALTLHGDGSQRRTFTHISDAVAGMVKVARTEAASGETFNHGGEALQIGEVARAIARKYGVAVEYVPWPEADFRIEMGDTVFDASKIDSWLGSRERHRYFDWVSGSSF